MEKHLHIVCLDVPYPVDYGGVFDLFYKLRYLKEQGVKIILHCFEYGRGRQPELEKYCEQVFYYKRKRGVRSLSLTVPYMVQSRTDKQLIKNLSGDSHPVLLEGTHCTLPLWKNRLANRTVILRLHNIEADYYRQLVQNENSFFRKLYYRFESTLLDRYEPEIIKKAGLVIPVSEKDAMSLKEKVPGDKIKSLPVFTGWNEVQSPEGSGAYCLYHGNLSVAENGAMALWLVQSIFNDLKIPLKIAGRRPSTRILTAVSAYPHIEIIADPDEIEMEKLIRNAQINLLPSFSSTGIKLKLLHAVFCGRHCITNRAMAAGTHLENVCTLAEDPPAFKAAVRVRMQQPVTKEMIIQRQQILEQYYNNSPNIRLLIQWIWNREF